MKKPVWFLVVLSVLLVSSFAVSAETLEGDASYLFGIGDTESRGFSVHAMAEVVANILADASFLSTSAAPTGDDNSSRQMISGGALYRVVTESDLEVFAGGGFVQLTTKTTGTDDLKGRGIYGKFGFKFLPIDKVFVMADVSFAPKYKVGEAQGNLISARATVSYEVMTGLGLQGTIKHYRTSTGAAISDTLVGGGLTFSF